MPTDPNALIARHMAKDTKWLCFAYTWCNRHTCWPDRCPPQCEDRTPREFADPANTLRLAGWWGWRLTHAPWTDRDADVAGEIDDAMGLVAAGFIVAAEGARRVRDIIAARLKEIDDGG